MPAIELKAGRGRILRVVFLISSLVHQSSIVAASTVQSYRMTLAVVRRIPVPAGERVSMVLSWGGEGSSSVCVSFGRAYPLTKIQIPISSCVLAVLWGGHAELSPANRSPESVWPPRKPRADRSNKVPLPWGGEAALSTGILCLKSTLVLRCQVRLSFPIHELTNVKWGK